MDNLIEIIDKFLHSTKICTVDCIAMPPGNHSEQYVLGMHEMRKHFGNAADKWIAIIADIYPEFAKVNVEFPFGELYHRDVVDDKTRELCTIAALTVQGFALPELKVHIKGALNTGSSREEILEIITQMIAYCGFPAATNALLAAKESFDDINVEAGTT